MAGQDQHARSVAPRQHGAVFVEPAAGERREVDGLRQGFGQTETVAGGVLFDGAQHDRARRSRSSASPIFNTPGQTKGPISFAPIDQVFADPSDAALSAKAANSNAAKLFIEYLCSPEGQKKVAETGEFVLAPGVFPAIKGADKIVTDLYMMDDPSADTLAKLQSDFRQLFLAK